MYKQIDTDGPCVLENGAVKAMEAHKAKEQEKFTKTKGLIHEGYVNDTELSLADKAYLMEDNEMNKFGVHQDWQVGEQELLV